VHWLRDDRVDHDDTASAFSTGWDAGINHVLNVNTDVVAKAIYESANPDNTWEALVQDAVLDPFWRDMISELRMAAMSVMSQLEARAE
jgi:hypothetical protein